MALVTKWSSAPAKWDKGVAVLDVHFIRGAVLRLVHQQQGSIKVSQCMYNEEFKKDQVLIAQ